MNDEEAKIVAAIKALIASKFNGDPKATFDHYATNGVLTKSGIESALEDAEVGSRLTWWVIAGRIVERYGSDDQITWDQVRAAIAAAGDQK